MTEDRAQWGVVGEAYAISSSGLRQAGEVDSDNEDGRDDEKYNTTALLLVFF